LHLSLPTAPGTTLAKTALKSYPSEYHSQAPLHLLAQLQPSIPFAEIEHIRIGSYWVVLDEISEPAKWTPTSRETADHSLPFLTAAMLTYGVIWTDSCYRSCPALSLKRIRT
jgi:2-methylcitrate dehydratase